MGIAYCCGIEAFHYGCNVRLDLVGYASRGGAFLARAALGSMALWSFRALYLDHLTPIKHNSVPSGAESARYTFFFWLIAFASLMVFSKKSD